MHTDYTSTSVLDHFVVSARLVPLVVQCQAIHSGDNLSRHSPILLQLNIGDIPSKHIDKSWVPRKPAWHKASVEVIGEYKEDLHSKLDQVTVPVSINCMDTMCGNEHHSKERDDMVLDILCAVFPWVVAKRLMVPLVQALKVGMCPAGGQKLNLLKKKLSSGIQSGSAVGSLTRALCTQ